MNNYNGYQPSQNPQQPQYQQQYQQTPGYQQQYQPPMYPQNYNSPKKGMGAGAITAIVLGSVAILAIITILFVIFFSVPVYDAEVYDDVGDDTGGYGENVDHTKKNTDGSYYISETVDGFSDDEWPDTITLDYPEGTVTFGYEKAPDYDYFLVVNGRKTSLRFAWIGKFQIIDDTIILNTGGYDILTNTLYALDMDGNILLEIITLEDNGMKISDEFPVYEIVNGDTFILHGSRAYHGGSLLIHNGIEWNEGDDFWDKFPDDEVVKATYEMKYLGNGAFGPIVRTEVTMTFDEYREWYQNL